MISIFYSMFHPILYCEPIQWPFADCDGCNVVALHAAHNGGVVAL